MSIKEVLDFLNISKWHDAGYKGQGVKVLMIDDGWEDRPWFDGKLHIVHSNGPSGSQHGIKTAETLHIVAPEAEIYVHEVSYPAYPTPDVVLRYILENDIHIVSMSMGGSIFRQPEYRSLLAEATKKAIFFTSAGNTGGPLTGAANDDEYWIAVGAAYLLKGKPMRESYSSIGPSLDVMGLTGIEVHSSDGQRLFAPEGTSFSCPVVAGMMAIYYSWFYEQYRRYPTPDEAKAFLFANCMDMEEQGRDDRTGHGLFVLPKEIPEVKVVNRPKYIIVHHSATKQGDTETFRRYHVEVNGWKDIGYHYVVNNGTYKSDGLIEKGRDEKEVGAHAIGYNDKSIGICLVGNFDEDRPTEKQMQSLIRLCKDIMRRYNIPAKNVLGHRETGAKKTCPGKNFDMEALRRMLEEKVITLRVGSKEMTVNGRKIALDVPAKVENGRTLVPLRAIAEAFGFSVHYDDKTKTITIRG
jgi:N-acetyl-anhydromuramyl-L-alanine amidase AmpD